MTGQSVHKSVLESSRKSEAISVLETQLVLKAIATLALICAGLVVFNAGYDLLVNGPYGEILFDLGVFEVTVKKAGALIILLSATLFFSSYKVFLIKKLSFSEHVNL